MGRLDGFSGEQGESMKIIRKIYRCIGRLCQFRARGFAKTQQLTFSTKRVAPVRYGQIKQFQKPVERVLKPRIILLAPFGRAIIFTPDITQLFRKREFKPTSSRSILILHTYCWIKSLTMEIICSRMSAFSIFRDRLFWLGRMLIIESYSIQESL